MKTVITLPKLVAQEAAAAGEAAAADPASDAGADTRPGTDLGSGRPSSRSDRATPPSSAARGPFAPLLLASLAMLAALSYQTWLAYSDRLVLQAAFTNQQPTVDNATKLRTSLDTLAADTQRLADAGNTSARLLVDELKKRGVTINAGIAAAGSPKP